MLRLLRCFRVLLVLLLVFGERGFGALRLEVPGGGGDSPAGTRFSLANARGEVTTQVDAAGNVTWQASYEAFGTRTREKGSNGDPQRANSKDEDPPQPAEPQKPASAPGVSSAGNTDPQTDRQAAGGVSVGIIITNENNNINVNQSSASSSSGN